MANKKKKSIGAVIFFIGCIVIGGLIGVLITQLGLFQDLTPLDYIIMFALLAPWVFLGIFVHELGHLVAGKMSGYTFGAFIVGSLAWFKEDGVIKFRRSKNFAAGQCIMVPPEDEAEFKFLFYNLGGSIFNFLTALILLPLWLVAPRDHLFADVVIVGLGVNVFFGLFNLIPIRALGNDGFNIVNGMKSADGKRAFYLILYINGLLMEGKRITEIDEAKVRVYGELDETNLLVGNALLFEMDYLLKTNRPEEALAIAEGVNIDQYSTLMRNLIHFYQLLIYVYYLPDFDKARAIYEDKDFKELLKMKLPNVSIVLPIYEFFVNEDHEKAEKLLVAAKKAVANLPNKGSRLGLMDSLEEFEEQMISRSKDV